LTTFDYIIVGAGSAGCVVASRLSADGDARVLLLEAGGEDSHFMIPMPLAGAKMFFDPSLNWNLQTEPEPQANNRCLRRPAGKVLGGGSSINAMIYTRGHPADFDRWAEMGCEGWSYDDVLPYFIKAETNWRGPSKAHGGDGPLSVSRQATDDLHDKIAAAVKAAGYPTSQDFSLTCEGFGISDFTTHRGRRGSTARSYLRSTGPRDNLTVVCNARATRILIENDRAVGVEYDQAGTQHVVRAEREVVLSCGSYHSPKLLLLSGVGPANELAELGIKPVHDLPGVGRNLSDHPAVGLTYRTHAPTAVDEQLRLDRLMASVLRWRLTGGGPVARFPVAGMAFLRSRAELDRPDIEILFAPAPLDARVWAPGWRKPNGQALTVDVVGMLPKSRGWIKLRSADPRDPPRILLNLLADPSDRRALIDGIAVARDIMSREPIFPLIAHEIAPGPETASDKALSAYLSQAVRGVHHVIGSCSMGTGPDAVVDPHLRVKGLLGLRVIDASIMPSHICAHTNAASIMVGEKGADLLASGN
jgi:choline dehydrogenase